MQTLSRFTLQRYKKDILAGLTVSVVTLSLGGAFGQLSGRGILIGMLSAAIIPIITSLLGGTRVQCSGPTGPMTATFMAIVVVATESFAGENGARVTEIMNLVLLLAALLMIIAAVLRIGNWIRVVPNIAISGFMNGIAFIIWFSQGGKLLQIGENGIQGPVYFNIMIALCTAFAAIGITRVLKNIPSHYADLLPGTLIAMIIVTVIVHAIGMPIEFAAVGLSLHSMEDIGRLFAQNSPFGLPWHLTIAVMPFAFQLASVAYMDTLLTSLIIDRIRQKKTARNTELTAQGIAMSVVALFGGVPGAQATERSVLLIREGAQSRLAGVSTGFCALAGIFLFQDVISLIPKAVFAGVLLKIGYDVFDWLPLRIWLRRGIGGMRSTHMHVSTLEMCMILSTAFITAFFDITFAIVGCTLVYYGLRQFSFLRNQLPDLIPVKETEGVMDES